VGYEMKVYVIYIYIIYMNVNGRAMVQVISADTSLWRLGFDPGPNHIKICTGKKEYLGVPCL